MDSGAFMDSSVGWGCVKTYAYDVFCGLPVVKAMHTRISQEYSSSTLDNWCSDELRGPFRHRDAQYDSITILVHQTLSI